MIDGFSNRIIKDTEGSILTPQTDLAELRNRLGEIAVNTLRKIAADTNFRMKNYKSNPLLLKEGIFYLNDHFLALSEKGSKSQLKRCVSQGAYLHGLAPSDFFEFQIDDKSPTGKRVLGIVIKPNVKPTDALEKLQKGLTFIACGEVCWITYYQALLEVLGKEKFDYLFSSESPTPLQLKFAHEMANHPLSLLVKAVKTDKYLKGQICHIPNCSIYADKHRKGEGVGYNVEFAGLDESGSNKYVGFGLDENGEILPQINKKLFHQYNDDPIGLGFITDIVADKFWKGITDLQKQNIEKLKGHKITYREFLQLKGGFIEPQVTDFDVEHIAQLIQLSPQQGRELLNFWIIQRFLFKSNP